MIFIFFRFPFNSKTLSGYLVCILIEILTILAAVELFTCALTITITFCLFVTDFISDLQENLLHLNESLIGTERKDQTIADEIKIKKSFIDIITFHSEAIK